MDAASACGWRGGTTRPLEPCDTTSVQPGMAVVTIGTPASAAPGIDRSPQVRSAVARAALAAAGGIETDNRARAFFESNAALITGYERRLAQGLEANALCAAQKAELMPQLAAALTGN